MNIKQKNVQNSLFTAHTKSVMMPGVPPECRTGHKGPEQKVRQRVRKRKYWDTGHHHRKNGISTQIKFYTRQTKHGNTNE